MIIIVQVFTLYAYDYNNTLYCVEQKIISKEKLKQMFEIRMTTWRGKQPKRTVFVNKKILQNVFFLVYDWTRNAFECTELNIQFQIFSLTSFPCCDTRWLALVAHSLDLAHDDNDLAMTWLTAKAGAATAYKLYVLNSYRPTG